MSRQPHLQAVAVRENRMSPHLAAQTLTSHPMASRCAHTSTRPVVRARTRKIPARTVCITRAVDVAVRSSLVEWRVRRVWPQVSQNAHTPSRMVKQDHTMSPRTRRARCNRGTMVPMTNRKTIPQPTAQRLQWTAASRA